MGISAQYLRVSEEELSLHKAKSIILEDRIEHIDAVDSNWLDIDKAWDGIIFLLTGNGSEKAHGDLLRIIVSTRYVDESLDFGYGPAHYVDAEEVKELYQKIAHFDRNTLLQRYDPSKMKELNIYPDIWDETEAFNYLFHFICEIQAFFRKAASNNEAIIGLMRCEIDELDCNQIDQKFSRTLERVQQFLRKVRSTRVVENAVLSTIIFASSAMSWQLGSLFGI